MALVFDIDVVPQSGRRECTIGGNNRIKCYLSSEQGEANEELVSFLSSKLNLPEDDVVIINGHTRIKDKTIKIEKRGITYEDVLKALGVQKAS